MVHQPLHGQSQSASPMAKTISHEQSQDDVSCKVTYDRDCIIIRGCQSCFIDLDPQAELMPTKWYTNNCQTESRQKLSNFLIAVVSLIELTPSRQEARGDTRPSGWKPSPCKSKQRSCPCLAHSPLSTSIYLSVVSLSFSLFLSSSIPLSRQCHKPGFAHIVHACLQ